MNKIMKLTMIAIAISVSVFMLSTSLLSHDTPTETRDASKMLYLVPPDHFYRGFLDLLSKLNCSLSK
jgi:hypothetical protein